MDSKALFLLVALTSFSVIFEAAEAQTGCTSAYLRLATCVNVLTGAEPAPSVTCCAGLSTVLQNGPLCVCDLFKGGGSSAFGIPVNQTLALQLPIKCNVTAPPLSECNETHAPAAAPTNSAHSPASSLTKPTVTEEGSGSPGLLPLSGGFVFLMASALVGLAAV